MSKPNSTIRAAGNSDGAQGGHYTRAAKTAVTASATAHEASATAHESGDEADHGAAKDAHEEASGAHFAAMQAASKANMPDEAKMHAETMVAHDACADAHDCQDADAVTASLERLNELVVKAKKAEPAVEKDFTSDVIHCRASGGNKISAAKDWKQGEPVSFMYMPSGLHTINAGFRNGGINLTVETDPQRDAEVCQASLDSLIQETPKQKAFGCFEHEEKQASVWANKFMAKDDGIYLEAEPSEAGAKAVNGKNHRSWSPSFTTNAEYSKCQCRKCDNGIKACKCPSPSYFFPEGVRGSESNPAQITGVDFCVGTLTNKPAFRAIAPVKARLQNEVIQAGGPGSGRHSETGGTANAASARASAKSKEADHVSELAEKGDADDHRYVASKNDAAMVAHRDAAAKNLDAGNPRQADIHTSMAMVHSNAAASHRAIAENMDKYSTKAVDHATSNTIRADAQDGDPCPPEGCPQPPAPKAIAKETPQSQMATKKAMLKTKIAQATEEAHPDGEAHGTKQNAHYNAQFAHQDAAQQASAGPVKDYHTEAADYHQDMAKQHAAVTASEGALADVDNILANVTSTESVDAILARLEPQSTRIIGFNNDLDAVDAILARLSGK